MTLVAEWRPYNPFLTANDPKGRIKIPTQNSINHRDFGRPVAGGAVFFASLFIFFYGVFDLHPEFHFVKFTVCNPAVMKKNVVTIFILDKTKTVGIYTEYCLFYRRYSPEQLIP
jgi:hypothetical protein